MASNNIDPNNAAFVNGMNQLWSQITNSTVMVNGQLTNFPGVDSLILNRSVLAASTNFGTSEVTGYNAVYPTQAMLDESALIHSNLNINPADEDSYYKNFDRYYSIYLDKEMDALRQWAFFVRPECNLVNPADPTKISTNCKNDDFIKNMVTGYNITTRQLTMELTSAHDFMTFPNAKIESLQIPDLSIKNSTISQPYTNLLMPYGGNAWESQTGGTFDISFRDDNMLRIHYMIQLWVHYIDCVSRGALDPKAKFYQYNKLDYATSLYYFVCKPDGESIVWWSKYTGVFPTTAPNSDMGFNLRGTAEPRLSVPFVYYFHEALNPDILVDFNRNARVSGVQSYVPHYNPDSVGTGNGVVGCPFVSGNSANGYKLRWKPATDFN